MKCFEIASSSHPEPTFHIIVPSFLLCAANISFVVFPWFSGFPLRSVCQGRQAKPVPWSQHQVCAWRGPRHQIDGWRPHRPANVWNREVGYRHNWSLFAVPSQKVERLECQLAVCPRCYEIWFKGWFRIPLAWTDEERNCRNMLIFFFWKYSSLSCLSVSPPPHPPSAPFIFLLFKRMKTEKKNGSKHVENRDWTCSKVVLPLHVLMCSFQATNLSDICFLMKLSQKTHWYVKVDELKHSRCFHSILSVSVLVVCFVLCENYVHILLSKTQHFTPVHQQHVRSVGF